MGAKRVLFMVLVASVVLLAVDAGPGRAGTIRALPQAQQPAGATIPYPGRLADKTGQAAPDGAYDLIFTLYAAETGGEPLWSEVQKGVAVQNGTFQAALGSVQALSPAILGGSQFWLAVSVRGPGEAGFTALAPRQQVSTAGALPPAGAVAQAACPHDHWGASWNGSGVGLYARSNNWVGLAGEATTSPIINPMPLGVFGVYGAGDDIGVFGESYGGTGVLGNSTNGAGVRGESTNHDGVSGSASASNRSGVYGYNSGSGYGVVGRSANGWGLEADGQDDGLFADRMGDLRLDGSYGDILATGFLRLWSDLDVYVSLDANNDGFNGFTIFDGEGWSRFNVDENGNLWASGSKSALVETADHGERLMYAMESPEVWFEDFGTASVVDGRAVVSIEPVFAETVNLEMDYHVFLTPLGDCQGLYVAAKTPTSFEVRELGGGTASIDFDYRLVARRRGYEDLRLEPVGERPSLRVDAEGQP